MKGLVVKTKNGTDATVEASNLKNRQGNELPWRNMGMPETKWPHTFGCQMELGLSTVTKVVCHATLESSDFVMLRQNGASSSKPSD